MGDAHVLERILDGAEDPTNLSLQLLQDITANFSEDRKIGQGGFGEVYKGLFGERIIAVKRIYINENTVDDKSFRAEVTSLMKINHQNVVWFLGFCSNTHCEPIKRAEPGEMVLVNVLERLVCLEYISNGSLDKHITDELRGFEWETRYEIITGICKGLCYLHEEKNIVHMDLKPANILLDDHMVPKITDFGLSRSNKNSRTMAQPIGTRGYIAPEYEKHGKTSFKADIYSVGAIIMELVTGGMEVPDKHNVLRRWRHRWNNPPTLLQYQQVTRCIDLAGRCRKQEPKDRPSISEIISFLSKSESTDGKISPCFDEDDMLGIKLPKLELWLASEVKNEISRRVELINGTRNRIAFNIQVPSAQYKAEPVKGIVQPGFMYVVTITVQARDVRVQKSDADKFIVQSTKLGDGDITDHTFRAEAGKVVDEVDFMVVYEPTKPQENCKHRKDTNKPAGEVPEAKERKIAESASGKGKNKLASSKNAEAASMDINSSAQGQCNLQPLQSFSRHYPTERKYLGRESDRAVDHARGAMGSLLDKLGKLVTKDYNLEKRVKTDIESFSEHLTVMHGDLPKLEKVDGAKIWVDEVRELSYHIEDMVDSFLVQVEPDSNGSGFRELTHEGLMLWENGMMTHHQIGDVIRDIKDKVQAMANKGKNYKMGVINATDRATFDPRMGIYRKKDQLIGIEAPRDEIISLFEEDGDVSKQELRIVSIVGMGGLGKTTLAKVVYEYYKPEKQYNIKAFVPVGQNPDLTTILKKIIRQCDQGTPKKYSATELEDLGGEELISKLYELLNDKRYFIVIDDIWDSSAWGVIESAFPGNERGSRVITTTRIRLVALACCNSESKYVYEIKPLSDEDSKRLFYRRIFGPRKDYYVTPRKEEISNYILERCSGMPLAINSIASLLAGGKDSTWEYVLKSLGALTEGNDGLKNMKQILDLSYIHLPDHLKTCLLYVCMYPEDREIDKNELLRKWVAEGFVHVSRNGVLDAEDVAEQYFEELINMCMIQPEKIDDYSNEVLSFGVHDIILDLLRSKSSEENFIHVTDGLKDVTGQIHRVTVHYNDKEDSRILETINKNKVSLSHARSVLLYRGSLVPYFLELKYVRVLHLEQTGYDLDLAGIGTMFLLRYLKIAFHMFPKRELKLPNQIGQLQQLETIDLEGSELKKYPSDIVSLPRLSYLRYGGPRGIALPDGIDRLKFLRTLVGVCVYKSSVDNLKGLGKLTNLRKLQFRSRREILEEGAMTMHLAALHTSICKLSSSLQILNLGKAPILDVSGWSKSLFPQASNIRELNLRSCNFQRCPQWVGQLRGLCSLLILVREVADGVSIVARLPSLAYFYLYTVPKAEEESVVISGSSGAFQALKHLVFRCPKTSLTFEAGAMPKLEKLNIMFRYHMARRYLPVGIGLLQADTLKEISLTMEFNDISERLSSTSYRAWKDYCASHPFERRQKEVEHVRRFTTIVKRAFKLHYPSTDIILYARTGHDEDDHNEDYVSVDDEEDCCNEEDYKVVADEDFGRMSSNTDVPLTPLHLAVGSEGRTEDLESLQLPLTSLINLSLCSLPDRAEPVANFPLDINNDLLVQQGNNGILVNAAGQYLDLNQAPPGGLVGIAASAAAAQPQAEAVDDDPCQDIFWDNLVTDSDEGAQDNDDGPCRDAFWDNLVTDSDNEGEAVVGQA